MATRAPAAVGRLAVQRARVRMPDLMPDTVEVVELVRGRAFVVVRTSPDGVVVLDEAGRLVRGRERLTTIALHLRAVRQVEGVLARAQLDRRLEHSTRSVTLIERLERHFRTTPVACEIDRVTGELGLLKTRLAALLDERVRSVPATERTLRRTITLLNEAARADRDTVRGTRALACVLLAAPGGGRASPVTTLRRWAVARLSAPDLPFFYPEFDDLERGSFVGRFVQSARA